MLRITFNFCLTPLKLSNIRKINIEVESNLQLSEALSEALKSYNSINKKNPIVDEETYYKIMLSDEEGFPEEDMPCNY